VIIVIKINYDAITGKILGYYPDDIGYSSIPEPFFEIDDTTHQDCVNNPGLRRVDLTTKTIVEYTPAAPTAEELKQQKIAALDAEYQPQFHSLQLSWAAASMEGDTTTADSVKSDYTALKAEYQTKLEAINNG
jgi:hypothetical protein